MRKINENYYENLICFVTGEKRFIRFSDKSRILYLCKNICYKGELIADHIWIRSDTNLNKSYICFNAITYKYYSYFNGYKKTGLKLTKLNKTEKFLNNSPEIVYNLKYKNKGI